LGNCPGNVSDITVTLTNFTAGVPRELCALLVAPNNLTTIIMCNTISSSPQDNITVPITLRFNDVASQQLPDGNNVFSAGNATFANISGATFKPSDYPPSANFTPPLVAVPGFDRPYGATLGVHTNSPAAGLWSLYVIDFFPNLGSLSVGGLNLDRWAIDIVTRIC
jgi:hypothetical protein